MSSNVRYLMSYDSVIRLSQGAFGAMTFGMYHFYVTDKAIEFNKQVMNDKMDRLKLDHKIDIDRLTERIDSLNKWPWQR